MKERKSIQRTIRLQLIKTRGVLCENCKTQRFEHIHHIDKDPSNNDFDNLILLCVNCHRETHSWFLRLGNIVKANAIKTGNGAHVYVPKDWIGRDVRVTLLE